MNRRVKVLIVDDHPAMALGTKVIIEVLETVVVVGIASTGSACIAMIVEHEPDIVVLDFHLQQENALDILEQIRAITSKLQIVIFTGIDYLPYYNDLLQLGVSGIMSKDSTDDQIRLMISCITEGFTLVPFQVFRQLGLHDSGHHESPLTDEEKHIMNLVIQGYTNEQIAGEIHMSKRSVDNYLKKIYEGLGVKSRAQAIEKFVGNK